MAKKNRDKNNGQRQMVAQQISATFAGPIPPPDMLIRYNDAVQDGAERILAMAERQAEHRIETEKKVIGSDIRRSWAGLVAAFVIAMAGFALAGYVAYLGNEVVGAIIGGLDVTSLSGSFIYGTVSRNREREKRARIMTGQG